jgi:hypothetical protein
VLHLWQRASAMWKNRCARHHINLAERKNKSLHKNTPFPYRSLGAHSLRRLEFQEGCPQGAAVIGAFTLSSVLRAIGSNALIR